MSAQTVRQRLCNITSTMFRQNNKLLRILGFVAYRDSVIINNTISIYYKAQNTQYFQVAVTLSLSY